MRAFYSLLFAVYCFSGSSAIADNVSNRQGSSERALHLGITAGYGERQDPFISEDDKRFYFLLDISYYGRYGFFDNGDLGAYLYTGETLAINVIAARKNDRDIFSPVNHIGRGLRLFAETNMLNDLMPARYPPAVITKRDNSIDAGLEFLFEGEHGSWQAQWLTDISNTHNGHELWAAYSDEYPLQNRIFSYSLGFNIKNSEYVDYYYGVTAAESSLLLPEYQGTRNVNLFMKLGYQHPLSKKLGLISILNYERFGNPIKQSPLIATQGFSTLFIGIYYRCY